MYEIIESAEGIDETAIPSEAYVPNAMGEHEVLGGQGGGSGMNNSAGTVFDADRH
jgi:SH3 domain-containing YSC84-like protein 1